MAAPSIAAALLTDDIHPSAAPAAPTQTAAGAHSPHHAETIIDHLYRDSRLVCRLQSSMITRHLHGLPVEA
jgi:hypothetical protein